MMCQMTNKFFDCAQSFGGFICLNLVYLLVFVLRKSLLSIASILLLVAMGVGLLLRIFVVGGIRMGDPPVGQQVEVVSKENISCMVECIFHSVNDALGQVRSILLWECGQKSFKIAAFLLVFCYIGSYFTLACLLFIGAWSVFILKFFAGSINNGIIPALSPYAKKTEFFIKQIVGAIPRLTEDDMKKVQ